MRRIIGARFNTCSMQNYYFVLRKRTTTSISSSSTNYDVKPNPWRFVNYYRSSNFNNGGTNWEVFLVHKSIPLSTFSASRPQKGCTSRSGSNNNIPWGYWYTKSVQGISNNCEYFEYFDSGPADQEVTIPEGNGHNYFNISGTTRADWWGGVYRSSFAYSHTYSNSLWVDPPISFQFSESQKDLICEAIKLRPEIIQRTQRDFG